MIQEQRRREQPLDQELEDLVDRYSFQTGNLLHNVQN
jgi:hypothetical protein